MTQRGILLFALMSVVWGIAYMLIRIAVSEVHPATMVLGRTVVGAAVLLPVALLRIDFRPTLRRWRWVAAFAIVEIAVPWFMLGSAEQQISSSLAGLLISGVPMVSVILALTTGGSDRMGRTGALGLLFGLLGVAAIVGGDFHADNLVALLQMAVVVVCYATGPAILARSLPGLPALAVISLSVTMVAVAYVPISFAAGWPMMVPSWQVIASILILGIVCTAVAFLAFGALIAEIGPVRATLITYINPAVAAVVGVVILGETFTAAMAVGFVLVLVGSALASRPGPRRPVEAALSPAP